MTALHTRNENFYIHRERGKLTAQQSHIIGRIQASNQRYGDHDFSLNEIAVLARLPISTVSGRVNELKRAGVLGEGRRRKCRVTGSTVTPVRLAA